MQAGFLDFVDIIDVGPEDYLAVLSLRPDCIDGLDERLRRMLYIMQVIAWF